MFHFDKDKDVIGVFAPSSYIEQEDIEMSQGFLEQLGYKVFIHPQTYNRHNQFAGTIDERIHALNDLWHTPEIGAIWCAGGGNGATWLIDHLYYERLRENPKPIIGFSDITALSSALYAHAGLNSIHGHVFKHIHDVNDRDLNATLDLLCGKNVEIPLDNAQIVKPGSAEGHLIGGNLSVFQYLMHTLPRRIWQGSILCLEDFAEELSHLDRTLLFFKRAGIFEQINGLILGEFINLKDTGRPYGIDFKDIILGHLEDINIPVIFNAPFGHGENNFPLPIGSRISLNTKNKTIKL